MAECVRWARAVRGLGARARCEGSVGERGGRTRWEDAVGGSLTSLISRTQRVPATWLGLVLGLVLVLVLGLGLGIVFALVLVIGLGLGLAW